MIRRLVLLLVCVLYLGSAYLCWTLLGWPQPRHVLGEDCWPAGFTSDGRHVVTYKRSQKSTPGTGSTEQATGPVQLWDMVSGALVASVLDEKRRLSYHVGLSPDGGRIAFREANGKLRVLELRTGAELLVFDLTTRAEPRFSPDGRFLAVCNALVEEEVRVWEVGANRPPLVLSGMTGDFAFSPDGKTLAATLARTQRPDLTRHEVQLFSLANGKLLRTFQARREISGRVVFAPDGSVLCGECSPIGGEPHCQVWNAQTAQDVCVLPGACQPRFSADGKTLIVYRDDGQFLIDATTWQERTQVPFAVGGFVQVADLNGTPSGLLVHSLHETQSAFDLLGWLRRSNSERKRNISTVAIHSAQTGAPVATIVRENEFQIPFLTPDDGTLLVWAWRGERHVLEVWDVPPFESPALRLGALIALTAAFGCVLWFAKGRPKRRSPEPRSGDGQHPSVPI